MHTALVCFLIRAYKTPETKNLYAGDYRKALYEIVTRYNLQVLDFTNDSALCFDKSLYRDPLHLNAKGANLYTAKIAEGFLPLTQQQIPDSLAAE